MAIAKPYIFFTKDPAMSEYSEDNANETAQSANSQTGSSQNDEAKVERYKQQMKWREEEARLAKEAQRSADERAERYRQSLINREYNRVYKNGTVDIDAIRELQNEDPEIADELAQRFTRENNDPISDASDLIGYLTGSLRTGSSIDEDALIEKAKRQILEDIEQRATMNKVISRFGNLPADKQQEAEAYYKKITGGRKVTADEAQEFADMASMYVMKGQIVSQRRDDNLASMGSMSFWGIQNSQQSGNGLSDADIADYLNGIGLNNINMNRTNVKLF